MAKPNWIEIDDRHVRHIWRDHEGGEHRIWPTFYADAGTPIGEDGDDMEYVRTEIYVGGER